MNTMTTIGTCSLCGGPVQVPDVWMGVIPPTPTCGHCGATQCEHGPVIEMQRPRTYDSHEIRYGNNTTTTASVWEVLFP